VLDVIQPGQDHTPASLGDDVLDRPIAGRHLRGDTLRQQLGSTATLLVFLRHFACLFCREMVADLRKAAGQDQAFPPVLFFHQGSVEEGEAFFADRFPAAVAVADPQRTFYDALGLTRGSTLQMFGPRAWACGFRALAKGNTVGMKVIGDPWLMPGVFLVRDGRITWKHAFGHAGDHPDWSQIPRT
jgi:hypothetical protein